MKDIFINFFKLLLLISIICFSVHFSRESYTGKVSMFSWDNSVLSKNEKKWLIDYMDRNNIDTLFQNFEYSEDFRKLAKDLDENNLDLYAVIGTPEMSLDKSGNILSKEINTIIEFNNHSNKNEKISGIVIDSEPYTSDEWKKLSSSEQRSILSSYSKNLRNIHKVTSSNNLLLVPCIPYFFEEYSMDATKDIILNASDEIAIINYNKSNEWEQIKTEVSFAKEKNIPVWCIYEFQPVGNYDLKEENTYYKEGLNSARTAFKKLLNISDYNNLYFSMHEYSILKFK